MGLTIRLSHEIRTAMMYSEQFKFYYIKNLAVDQHRLFKEPFIVLCMANKHRLVEIYQQNQIIEEQSTATGSKAKLLIHRCREALKIMTGLEGHYAAESLKKHIEEMEDELAKNNEIKMFNYNLDARIDIHTAIQFNNLFGVKDGWMMESGKWLYHWYILGNSICGKIKDYVPDHEPVGSPRKKEQACPKCLEYFVDMQAKEIKKNWKKGWSYSSMYAGVTVQVDGKGKTTVKW